MRKSIKIILIALLVIVIVALSINLIGGGNVAVLNPQGTIAEQQRNLIVFTVMLSAIVVIPVFIMLFAFAWRYREGNTKAKYTPNKDSNWLLEVVWWGIPCIIILVLSIVTWRTSHSLDPYKPLDSNVKPVKIQVVALQWKWLFIYPEQDVASVNLVTFPAKTPVNFEITSDAPMNSFWIPSLAGQIYAMSGMSTKLHIMADKPGVYEGASANISGEGFASMKFKAKATTKDDFEAWVRSAKNSGNDLTLESYNQLARPAIAKQPKLYDLKENNLYDTIVMKYMMPHDESSDGPMSHLEGM